MPTALKETHGKASYHLLVDEFVEEMIRVREHGSEKYEKWDWMRGRDWSDYIDAIRRHATDFNQGESVDPDSGLHHTAHIAVNCMFLFWLDATGQGRDNRHHQLAKRMLEMLATIDDSKFHDDA